VWPVLIGYRELVRTLIAWCELRDNFRSFRLDRMLSAEILPARAPVRPAVLRRQWLKALADYQAAHPAA
jgi:predicted DNA-binding transcriptional regulator YafY